MKYFIVVSWFIVCATLYSCKQKVVNNKLSQADDLKRISNVEDTLVYTYREFKMRATDCGNKPDSECTVVSIKYPEFGNLKAINDSIKHKRVSLFSGSASPGDTSLQKYAVNFINQYVKDSRRELSGPWKADVEAKVLLQSSGLVTVYFSVESYDGGGHGHNRFSFINWNRKTSKIFTLKDILVDNYQNQLTKIAEKIFRRQENLSDTSSLTDYGYLIRDGIFRLNNNFLITKESITFLYNDYEIKPYSESTIQIDIPYSQIKSLLRPNTVLAQYIK